MLCPQMVKEQRSKKGRTLCEGCFTKSLKPIHKGKAFINESALKVPPLSKLAVTF